MPDGQTPEVPKAKIGETKTLEDVSQSPILPEREIKAVLTSPETPKSPSQTLKDLESDSPKAKGAAGRVSDMNRLAHLDDEVWEFPEFEPPVTTEPALSEGRILDTGRRSLDLSDIPVMKGGSGDDEPWEFPGATPPVAPPPGGRPPAPPAPEGGDPPRDDDREIANGITLAELRTLTPEQQVEFLRGLPPNRQEEVAREMGFNRVRRGGVGRNLINMARRREAEYDFVPQEMPVVEEERRDVPMVNGVEVGIRRIEKMPPRNVETEPLPEIENAIENLCSVYKDWFEEGRMTPGLIVEFNKRFGHIIEFVEAKRRDDRLLNLEDDARRFLSENFDDLKLPNEVVGSNLSDEEKEAVRKRSADFQKDFRNADLGGKLDIIEQRATRPGIIQEREGLDKKFKDLKAEALQGNEAKRAYEGLRAQLRRTDGDEISAVAEAKLVAQAIGENTPAAREIIRAAQDFEGHISSRFIKFNREVSAKRMEILEELVFGERQDDEDVERIELPNRSFEESLAAWNGGGTDAEVEQGERDVKAYLKAAKDIGMLARSKRSLDLQAAMLNGQLDQGEDAKVLIGRLEDDFDDEQAVRAQEDFDMRALKEDMVFEDEVEINGVKKGLADFSGVITFYRQQGNRSQREYLLNEMYKRGGKNADINWGIMDEVWSWRAIRKAAEDEQEAERQKHLWDIQWSNSYTLDRCNSVEDLLTASNQHIKFIQDTEKTPEAALQKIQFFSEAIGARGKALGTEAEIAEIRLMYQAEAYAYLSEQFNRAYNVRNLAAVYAKMNNEFEGMDHWKAAAQLREGLVYRAYLIQQATEYELMYRMMGPHGQMDRHTNGQLLINRMMKQRLAESLVGEVISDTYAEEAGLTVKGAEARSKNLNSLGFDRPQGDTEKAYVARNADLFRSKGLRREDITEGILEAKVKVKDEDVPLFTEAEKKALTLRDIKARIAREKGFKFDTSDILPYNALRKVTSKEKKAYKDSLAQATEAVSIFMQLSSMTGDKTVRGGPSYMARPEGPNGLEATRSRDVLGTDKVPVWMAENFVHYAINMARITWEKDNPGRSRQEEYHHNGHDVNIFDEYINRVRDAAIKEIYEKGWDAKLPKYEAHISTHKKTQYGDEGELVQIEEVHTSLESHGTYKYKHVVKGVEREDDVGLLYTAGHVLGRYLDSTYVANQKEIHTQISSEQIREQARQLRDGEKKEDEVNVLAVLRLIIDPTLNRITQVAKSQQKHEEAYILAAAHGTYMDHWEIRRALSIQFDDLTEFEIPNFDGGTKRMFYPQALAASNPDRWSPRARYMVARDIIPETSLGGKLGLKHSFDALKLMKRTNVKEEEIDQQVIDNPLLASAPQGYVLASIMFGKLFGHDTESGHEPGVHEKPTRSAEEIRSDHIIGKVETGFPLVPVLLHDGSWGMEFHSYNHQKEFLKQIQAILSPGRDICEFFRKFSDNTTATGARDLRKVDLFDWTKQQDGGEGFYKFDFDKASTSGVGLGRHLTAMWAKDFLTYMSRYRMKGADGTWRYNGALVEYSSEIGWWKLLNAVVRVSELTDDDKAVLKSVNNGKLPEHTTVIDFLVSKWSRR